MDLLKLDHKLKLKQGFKKYENKILKIKKKIKFTQYLHLVKSADLLNYINKFYIIFSFIRHKKHEIIKV